MKPGACRPRELRASIALVAWCAAALVGLVLGGCRLESIDCTGACGARGVAVMRSEMVGSGCNAEIHPVCICVGAGAQPDGGASR